jgi:hypothetical protein
VLAVVGLGDKGRDCLFRPTVGTGPSEELLAALDVHHGAVEDERFSHQLGRAAEPLRLVHASW